MVYIMGLKCDIWLEVNALPSHRSQTRLARQAHACLTLSPTLGFLLDSGCVTCYAANAPWFLKGLDPGMSSR
jgi:hypothetical protein